MLMKLVLFGVLSCTTEVQPAPQFVTAAVIGAVITSSTNLVTNLLPSKLPPGEKGGCNWQGTAPFCGGSKRGTCTANRGYEAVRTEKYCDDDKIGFGCHNGNRAFGSECATGYKTLCCRGNTDGVWVGNWESQDDAMIWDCFIERVTESECGGKLVCENTNRERVSWAIGGPYELDDTPSNKDKLSVDCKTLQIDQNIEAQALPGKISFINGQWDGNTWYKV